MKKTLIIFVLVSVVFGFYSKENILWCKKLLFNDPTYHTIQAGEYFSKLSQQYYGTPKYWRELALVNRAPNKDLVVPGEKVIIPGLEAIKQLSHSRTLTAVNEIVGHQEEWLAKYGSENNTQLADQGTQPPVQSYLPSEQIGVTPPPTDEKRNKAERIRPRMLNEPTIPNNDLKESSALPLILTLVAVALVIGIMSLYLYRRKRMYQLEESEPTEADEEKQTADDDEADDVFVRHYPNQERKGALVN